jgi:hypothetical protein
MSKNKLWRRNTDEYKQELQELENNSPIQKPHFIFSPENPKYEQKTPMSYDETFNHLKQKGYNVNPVKGKYDKKQENTFIVSDVKEDDLDHLIQLATDLGQESSIYSTGKEHKLMYHHGANKGKYYKGTGTNFYEQEPEDNYTTVNNKHFSHNFDWDNMHEQEPVKPVSKYRFQSMKKSEIFGKKDDQPKSFSRELSGSHMGHGKQLYHHVIKEPNNVVHHVISYDKQHTPQNPSVARISGTVDANNNFSVNKININEGHDAEKESTRALIGTMFHHNNVSVPNNFANSLNRIKSIKGYGVTPSETHHQVSLGEAFKSPFYSKYYRTFRESMADGQKMEKSLKHAGTALGLATLMGYLYQNEMGIKPKTQEPQQVTREIASTAPEYDDHELDFKRRTLAGVKQVNPEHIYQYLSKNPQAHTRTYSGFDNFYHDYKKDPNEWKERYFDYAFKEHKGIRPKITQSMFNGIYHDK